MSSEKVPMYVVSGENRLTGEREALSRPRSYVIAYRTLLKAQEQSYRRRHHAYVKLRLEPAEVYAQQRLDFK